MQPNLSARARSLLARPGMPPYLVEHFARSTEPWDRDDRPEGYLPLCIAENKLVWDLLAPVVHAPGPSLPKRSGIAT